MSGKYQEMDSAKLGWVLNEDKKQSSQPSIGRRHEMMMMNDVLLVQFHYDDQVFHA